MKNSLDSFFNKYLNLNTVLGILVLITLVISIQQYWLPDREFMGSMRPQYNNYLIFKFSFAHLINDLNLYELYLDEYADYFKYSPTFAFFMGIFYYLPDWLGLTLWNLVNTICLFIGIKLLPHLDQKNKIYIILLAIFELIGNLQNEQSNALVTGLILLTFVFFERKNVIVAALFVVLAIYIKIFGIVAAALFLLYPRKLRFLLFLGIWVVILWALPLLVISPAELINQYSNWLVLLKTDQSISYGFSVMGVLNQWFGLSPAQWLLTLIGIIIFCFGYIRRDLFKDLTYRYLFLSSILIWIIIFNHKAESPTFIVAMVGCGIWYFVQKPTTLNKVAIILAFVFISFTLTDLFPHEMRSLLYDYYLKAIPAILIWCIIIYQMVSGNFKSNLSTE